MSEVCTYGGDGELIAGYVQIPAIDARDNALTATRTPYASVSTVMWTVKVNYDDIGRRQPIIVWGSPAGGGFGTGGLQLTGDRRLEIDVIPAIGGLDSEIPVPDLVVGIDVWLRARLTMSTGLCEYWYSYDETLAEDLVTFIPLGTAQDGPSGSPNLGHTQFTTIGNWGLFTTNSDEGLGGRMSYASETVNGVRTMVMQHTDIPDNSANSFPLSLGGTATVHRATLEPRTFLSPFSASDTYGTGHYGLCDQVQGRSCSPASSARNPVTVGASFADCEQRRSCA